MLFARPSAACSMASSGSGAVSTVTPLRGSEWKRRSMDSVYPSTAAALTRARSCMIDSSGLQPLATACVSSLTTFRVAVRLSLV